MTEDPHVGATGARGQKGDTGAAGAPGAPASNGWIDWDPKVVASIGAAILAVAALAVASFLFSKNARYDSALLSCEHVNQRHRAAYQDIAKRFVAAPAEVSLVYGILGYILPLHDGRDGRLTCVQYVHTDGLSHGL
jgi:hypothetical protein